MREYFIISNSFAAPICGDRDFHYIKAHSAREALEKLATSYDHPFKLYQASCYESADDYHKKLPHLAEWASNACVAVRNAGEQGCYAVTNARQGKVL